MSAVSTSAGAGPIRSTGSADDPEALMNQVWQLVERIRALASDPKLYHVELIREGAERGDLNLIEVGLHRFRDVTPLDDDDD
jgi:hypothetical protein